MSLKRLADYVLSLENHLDIVCFESTKVSTQYKSRLLIKHTELLLS